jgi:hypothetical protein
MHCRAPADIHFLAKMIYREKYDETTTNAELRHINKDRIWKCDTIRFKLGEEFGIDCENCRFRKSTVGGATIAGSAPMKCGTATACDDRLQILDGRLIWTEGVFRWCVVTRVKRSSGHTSSLLTASQLRGRSIARSHRVKRNRNYSPFRKSPPHNPPLRRSTAFS